MNTFWLNILMGGIIMLVTIFTPMITHTIANRPIRVDKRNRKNWLSEHHAKLEADRIRVENWGKLTKADRVWFEYNYWTGGAVLDERGPAPEDMSTPPVRDCNHEHYLEMWAVFEPESSYFCADCGAEL